MEYENLLESFIDLGYNRESRLSKAQFIKALSQISMKNNECQFDDEIATQLWNECQKLANDEVVLKKIIFVIIEAKKILEKNLNELRLKIQQIQNELQLPTSMNMSKKTMEYKNKEKALRNMKLQITQQIKEWSEDYKKINCLFNLSKINQNSHRITTNPKDNFQSLILLLAFVIILFFTELFLMIHKNNFWNITVSLLSISIFTFKYFDKIYIRLLIGLFFISIGFDIAWTLFKFENYWNLSRQGLEISKIGAFYKFIWVINILLIIIKIVILAILLKYKDNQEHHKMIIGHIIIILNPQKDQNQISTIIDRMFKKY